MIKKEIKILFYLLLATTFLFSTSSISFNDTISEEIIEEHDRVENSSDFFSIQKNVFSKVSSGDRDYDFFLKSIHINFSFFNYIVENNPNVKYSQSIFDNNRYYLKYCSLLFYS